MTRVHDRRRTAAICVLVAVGAAISVSILFSGPERPLGEGHSPLMKPTGSPQLVSVEPLPEMGTDGEMCQWVPASSQSGLLALLQEERLGAHAAGAADTRTSVALERPPLRVIHDSFPTYSAVAVDIRNNEIVLQDENLFQVMVYDRTANTPPKASLTEPKRVISGPATKIEFNCALYVDPKSGDVYTVSNDTMTTVSVFSRNARGNVRADREFRTPIRTFGIAVDEASEELFLTVQSPPEVLVYRKVSQGEEPPIRVLRGNKTKLGDAHGIGLDTKNGWMFVANYGSLAEFREGAAGEPIRFGLPLHPSEFVLGSGRYESPSITAYPIKASGDTPPLRTIQGPKTQMNWPAHLYVDDAHGEVFLANDGDDSILVFRETDNGNVAPTRVLKGPRTQLKNPTGVFLDTLNDELVVANMANHRATVYPRTAQGDTPPIRTIRAAADGVPALQIANPAGVAYDARREQIIVPN